MAKDRELTVVEPADWAELRDLYLHEWPRYEPAYHTVQNFIDWLEKSQLQPEDVTIYSLPEAWRKDGTIIVVSRQCLYIYTLEETLDTLRRTLLAFQWDRMYLVAMTCYQSLVLEVYDTLRLEKLFDVPNVLYRLPSEQAAQLSVELPEGFTIDRIDPKHAGFINEQWQHKTSGTEALISRLLQRNASMGLYDAQGQLVGWCLRGENGAMQMLGVATKRKGYGSLVIKAFARSLAARGLNSYACVMTINDASHAMFQKLGFMAVCGVNFLKTQAKIAERVTKD